MLRKRRLFKSKIQKYAFLAYVSIMGIFFVLLLILYGYIASNMWQIAMKNQNDMTKKISDQVEIFLSHMDRVALQVSCNSSIQNAFQNIGEAGGQDNYFNENISVRNGVEKH